MIPADKRRQYLVQGAVAAALLVAFGIWTFSASGRARRIAAKNADARGGVAAWRKVKTMTMSGHLDAGARRDPVKLAMAYTNQARLRAKARMALAGTSPNDKQVQLPFTLELARTRKSRLEIRFEGQTAVQVYDGKNGWKLRPFLGRRDVEAYSPDELRVAEQEADLDGWLIDASAKGEKLELVGSDKVDGHDAYNIKVTLPDGQVRHVWVDKQTSLEVKVDGTRRLDGKPRPVYTYFRDYKKVDGLMIPHVLETVVDGVSGSEKIEIEHVAVNPPLAESRFAKLDAEAVANQDAQWKLAANASATSATTAPAAGTGKLARATRTTAEYTVPHLSMQRDDGKTVAFPDELDDGRVVVLDFVFTNCATICPVMSGTFSKLQDKLGADRGKVHLVSISIDPEEDRPAKLAEYAKKLHAGPEWRQYTGTTQASVALQRAFDAYRGDKMNHTPVTFLRGKPGTPWVRIDGFASADELANEVRALVAKR